jgi:hypothetical protein
MRLVDADALKHEIVGTIPMMATVRIPIEHKIDASPTIDAIPVEWIHSQMKNNPNDIESAYDDICIGELIEKWQKEQEAR